MLPSIGQVLNLQIASTDETLADISYKSRIADVSNTYLYIEVPTEEKTGRMRRLVIGDIISISYVADGSTFFFSSKVAGQRDDNIRLFAIVKPELQAITRIQRRSFLRVPAELEIAVSCNESGRFVTRTEDISGGGLSFYTDSRISLKMNDLLTCWAIIPFRNGEVDHVSFSGIILRVKPQGKIQLVMVQFSEIAEHERQKIVKYCFERQLEMRK